MNDGALNAVAEWVAALPLPETVANPYPLYAQLRSATPVFGYQDYPPGTIPGQDEPVTAWALMKHAEVDAAARDHETFSSRDPLQEASSAPSLMLVNHDNPDHDRLRRFVHTAFSFRAIEQHQPWIERCIGDMVQVLPEGEMEVVAELASVIPARVMMHLLGLPDEDAPECRDWATAFMLSADLTPQQREASNQSMATYFMQQVAAMDALLKAGATPPEGLICTLLTTEVDGERLSLEEVILFCLTLVVAGAETTTYLLTNLLHNLATMPQVADQLRTDQSLVLPFINETLRHSGPPQRLFRVASRDVEIGGKAIAQGDWVALFFAAANHDPAVFPNPERFDLARKNLRQQLSMGVGIHHCLGIAVAKMEAAALVTAVMDRFPHLSLGSTQPVPQTASLLTHSFAELTLNFSR
jgi:cytochrome P450